MSLAQRVLLTWLFTLLFLIILVLKLDETLAWSWFLVFIPLWIFDAVLLIMLAVRLAGRCKAGYDRHSGHVRRKVWYLCATLLKLAFLLALCARLERLAALRLSWILAPLWLLLCGVVGDLGYSTFTVRA